MILSIGLANKPWSEIERMFAEFADVEKNFVDAEVARRIESRGFRGLAADHPDEIDELRAVIHFNSEKHDVLVAADKSLRRFLEGNSQPRWLDRPDLGLNLWRYRFSLPTGWSSHERLKR